MHKEMRIRRNKIISNNNNKSLFILNNRTEPRYILNSRTGRTIPYQVAKITFLWKSTRLSIQKVVRFFITHTKQPD